MTMGPADSGVAGRLDADRKALLDLSLRNPLLNYIPRSRSVDVLGESADQLVRVLVRERKRMSFRPLEKVEKDSADSNSVTQDPLALARSTANREDLALQTALHAEDLQSRLLSIYYAARTSLEELGVNTLYLALGILVWVDPNTPGRRIRAPLLLVPVELERSNARDRFRIRHADEEFAANLSLSEKLRTEFAIKLPELPEGDDLLPEPYFQQVEELIAEREGWSVDRDAIVLGFFSFGKFLMYRDIADEAWPDGAKPEQHSIVRALLSEGFHEEAATIGEHDQLDPYLKPETSHLVLDADGSQTLAILDVLAGRNLVIQGPPGTGKSQTIANLIAEALAANKSVLFVAEKMAALEVVKHRLDRAGLGDICLELHSHKTSKKTILGDLKRTLELGRPKLGRFDEDFKILGETRDRLSAYCRALKQPIGETEVTPYQAFGELLQLREHKLESPPELAMPGLSTWSRYDLRRRQGLLEELQARLKFVGLPRAHPFWGTRRTLLLPAELERLRDLIRVALVATTTLHEAADRLAQRMSLPPTSTRGEGEVLERGARRASKLAQRPITDIGREEWYTRRNEVEQLIEAGTKLSELHERFDETFVPEAWNEDLKETRNDLNTYGRSWWRWLSGRYHRANRKVAALCRKTPPHLLEAKLDLVDTVIAAGRQRADLERLHPLGSQLFGSRWQGERSKWSALAPQAKAIIQLHVDTRSKRLPQGVLDFLARQPDFTDVVPMIDALKRGLTVHQEAIQRLVEFMVFDGKARFQNDLKLEEQPWQTQEELLKLWSEHVEELTPLVAFNHLAERCRQDGLTEVVSIAESWPGAASDLVLLFRRNWYEQLLSWAFQERKEIAGFDGRGHEHVIGTFRELDRLSLRHNRARLADLHWERLPRHSGSGQLAVLRREFEKKTRHLPIRQLLSKASNAVKTIKPVFLMSPLSVAAYLAPGQIQFDLVVFDEASQVKPVDALGAILRAKQVVVVGDSRQLPPTDFFSRMTEDDDLQDESASDVESILGLFTSQGAPQRMLRWHYRSRHESLIAVSNREFYENRLLVFPSPDAKKGEAGLVLHRTPDSAYDRGGSRTNVGEAEAIVAAVFEHARVQLSRPVERRLSLGVASFSRVQTEAIRDRLERRRRAEPALEEFFATTGNEPFFVKNLENVQGDERDVIFISVGYGRTNDGELALNFGPLNDEGGERRLNVLITRARLRCEIFTNLTSNDIDLNRTRSLGMRAFKTFLAYAEGSDTLEAPADGAVSEDRFEHVVHAALSTQGLDVRGPIGSPSASIGLAVVDPEHPGKYLMAIESDGTHYQETTSSRDRDRLRPQVLESLGWNIARVWSTDWVRNPSGELKRLVALFDEYKRSRAQTVVEESTVVAPVEIEQTSQNADLVDQADFDRVDEDREVVTEIALPRYQTTTWDGERPGSLDLAGVDQLARWVTDVVETESPVHPDEVLRRLADASGLKRLGSRIQTEVASATDHACQMGMIRQKAEFLWRPDMTVPPLRDRRDLPANARRLELIAPEELTLAVDRVICDSLGIDPEAIPPAVSRLLGFPRTTDEMKDQVESILATMLEAGQVASVGGQLVRVESPPNPS